jgi:AcrR family transcriptional regulator
MSTTDIMRYDELMGRWEPNARGRLVEAALELYSDRGYDQTTVAEIARRAGLTERTFFRHFTDKREVLFSGAGELQDQLVHALDNAPDSLPAIDAIALALEAVAVGFSERHEFARRRQTIIAQNAELAERERIKLASLASALADGLQRRGVRDPAATLAAEMGIAVFRVAFERWIGETKQPDLSRTLRTSFDELKAVAAGK